MPARILGNEVREAWLKRAHTVLEAVDTAMTLEIQRANRRPTTSAAASENRRRPAL